MYFAKANRSILSILKVPFSILRPFNVCIWHSGRCGSTVLGDLLQQDGRIVWGGELLGSYSNRVEALNYQRTAAWLSAKRRIRYNQLAAGAKIFGFEMKLRHLERMELEPKMVLDFLRQQKYDKQIILERKNYLRCIVSDALAIQTGKYHSKIGESLVSAKIRLDPRNIQLFLQGFDRFYDEMKRLLSDNCLLLTYEDDILPDPAIAYRKVVKYLGLTLRDPKVTYQRTQLRDLQKTVANVDEILEHLKGTKYEWMLTSK